MRFAAINFVRPSPLAVIIAALLFVPATLSLTACGGEETPAPLPPTTTIGSSASAPASTPSSMHMEHTAEVREVEVVHPVVVVEHPAPASPHVVLEVPAPPSVTLHAPTPPHVEVH